MNSEQPPGDWKPRPDPTVLTTEQLHREINSLESRITAEIDALKMLLEASIRSITEILDAKTAILDTKVDAHNTLDNERFDRLDTRFNTIDKHRLEQKEDTYHRLDYVISTLKERADEHFKQNQALVEKSELGILDSIAKLGGSFQTTTDANQGRIEDIKERVGRIESLREGAAGERTEGRAQVSSTTAIVGTVIAIIAVGLALLVGRNTGEQQKPDVIIPTTPVVTVTTSNP